MIEVSILISPCAEVDLLPYHLLRDGLLLLLQLLRLQWKETLIELPLIDSCTPASACYEMMRLERPIEVVKTVLEDILEDVVPHLSV